MLFDAGSLRLVYSR